MKSLLTIFAFACSLLTTNSFAQISGNQVYGNNNNYRNSHNRFLQSARTTDTTMVVSSRILLNKAPDYYLVSLGVSEEGQTVKEGLAQINERINNFITDLNTIGVKKDDYYVDFISQTKVYDYKVEERRAEQYEYGFEIKKNVIVKLTALDQFDQLITLAAQQDIFDIIKVDYRNNEVDAIYEDMYNTAVKVIDKKRNLYLKTNSAKLTGKQRIIGDQFSSTYPESQYKKYQAFESSDLNVYTKSLSSNYVKKEMRKSTTFYYDGSEISGFDKIINGDSPVVGIQYFFELSVVYETEK